MDRTLHRYLSDEMEESPEDTLCKALDWRETLGEILFAFDSANKPAIQQLQKTVQRTLSDLAAAKYTIKFITTSKEFVLETGFFPTSYEAAQYAEKQLGENPKYKRFRGFRVYTFDVGPIFSAKQDPFLELAPYKQRDGLDTAVRDWLLEHGLNGFRLNFAGWHGEVYYSATDHHWWLKADDGGFCELPTFWDITGYLDDLETEELTMWLAQLPSLSQEDAAESNSHVSPCYY